MLNPESHLGNVNLKWTGAMIDQIRFSDGKVGERPFEAGLVVATQYETTLSWKRMALRARVEAPGLGANQARVFQRLQQCRLLPKAQVTHRMLLTLCD